jgi:hypothetical protein
LKPTRGAVGDDRRGDRTGRYQMTAEIEQLLQLTIGRFGLSECLSFDLEVLDAFPQSLIFSSESRERVVIFPKIGDPINRSLGSDLQRPHDPHQQSAERLIFQLAARGRDQNVNRQKETETSAQRNLILTKKSEHGRLDCLQ